MPKKPLTELEMDEAGEISVVDWGANNKKRFPVWKSKDHKMDEIETIIQAVIEQEVDAEKGLAELVTKAKLSEKGAAAVKTVVRMLEGFKDELPPNILGMLAGLTKMEAPAPAKKKEEEDGKLPEVKKEENKPIAKALADLPEPVRKALEEKDAARDLEIKTLTDNNAKITKALEDEKDARELAGWVEKAKTELSHYPGESFEESAASLHAIHKINPKLAETQFASMKKASDALKGSEIFKNKGSKGDVAGGSAWDKIEKMAAGIVEKSADTSVTKAQAITRVLATEEGQALYAEYEAEKEV